MANVVSQVRTIRASVNGTDFDGMIEEFHPPGLVIMTSDYYGGLDISIPLEMGMEALISRLVVNGYHGVFLNQFGLIDDRAVQMNVKGALVDYNGNVKSIEWKLRGKVITMPFSRIQGRAQIAKAIIEMTCDKYELYIDSNEHHYIEPMKRIRRIGGVDQLEKLRTAIGAR